MAPDPPPILSAFISARKVMTKFQGAALPAAEYLGSMDDPWEIHGSLSRYCRVHAKLRIFIWLVVEPPAPLKNVNWDDEIPN